MWNGKFASLNFNAKIILQYGCDSFLLWLFTINQKFALTEINDFLSFLSMLHHIWKQLIILSSLNLLFLSIVLYILCGWGNCLLVFLNFPNWIFVIFSDLYIPNKISISAFSCEAFFQLRFRWDIHFSVFIL